MDSNKESSILMATSFYLDADESGKCVDQTKYRGMISSLLYLTASHLDIMHNICVCEAFQLCPKESHLTNVKRVFKYLIGTRGLGLWYPRGPNISLIRYSDYDFGGCKVDRKSISGTCHLLGCSLVTWHSRKQACVALSTSEAKYIIVGSFYAQSIWIKHQLEYYGIHLVNIPLMCDNINAINLTKNSITHSRMKHIETIHHFIRDHVTKRSAKLNTQTLITN